MDASLANLPPSSAIYEAALEGLARVNTELYLRDSEMPAIENAGVRYERESGETWRHVAEVLADGWGDCEDLAAARVGYLRARGIDPAARVIVRRTGPRMSHALVRRGDGTVSDPSRELGMGRAKSMKNEDADWEGIGADPSASLDISWTLERHGTGWRGTIRVPLDAGRMLLVSRTAAGASGAKKKAVTAAARVLDNPAVAALIPPQARFALNLARSPKARAIAKKLLSIF
jgi:hypothetical protein